MWIQKSWFHRIESGMVVFKGWREGVDQWLLFHT
jgi:hypothetical protein